MKKEISTALLEFHQKILKPELDEIKEKQSEHDGRFLDMLGHFDGVYKKLENLEVEYHSIVAGMDRLEKTQDRQGEQLSAKLDSVADDLTAHLRDTEAHKGGYRAGEELERSEERRGGKEWRSRGSPDH